MDLLGMVMGGMEMREMETKPIEMWGMKINGRFGIQKETENHCESNKIYLELLLRAASVEDS